MMRRPARTRPITATFLAGLAAAIGSPICAAAAPPPNADPSLAPWFNSLRQPGSGISCCSVADCRRTEARFKGDQYEAFVDGQWRVVPPGAVLDRQDNPTGRAVVCYTPARGIMCFVKAPDA
jgi:hypothetical protein